MSRKFAQKLKYVLTTLQCPFTDAVDESWITELILTPGEQRIRLLRWLLIKFDDSLEHILISSDVLAAGKIDSRLEKILLVCSTLGLCKKTDVDLIKGTSSVEDQEKFVTNLLDIVAIANGINISEFATHEESSSRITAPELTREVITACSYVQNLLNTYNVNQIFSTKCHVMPPDMMQAIDRRSKEHSHQKKELSFAQDPSKLSAELESLQIKLQGQKMILQELQINNSLEKNSPEQITTICTKLQNALQEFSQLVESVQACYETELKYWCNKEAPRLNNLGPKCKEVHELLTNFSQVLSWIRNLREDDEELSNGVLNTLRGFKKSQQQRNLLQSHSKGLAGGKTKFSLEDYQHGVQVLEESVHLLQSSTN